MHPKMHPPHTTVSTTVEAAVSHAKNEPSTLRPDPPGEHTSKRLEALARDFAAQVRRDCAEEHERDPKALRAAVLRQVRRSLPLRRGRPNDPRIDAAIRMLDQGKSVKEILRLQTRNFDKVDAYGRYLAEKGLRTSVTRRRKRTRNAP